MSIVDLLNRPWPPIPWEGTNLPWGEPGFSERMLAEHLSQAHDLGSRSQRYIDRAVNWVHSDVLKKRPSRILDLGCGPGLYAKSFSDRGHEVVGIDISPASIRHAQMLCPSALFIQGDWRAVEYPGQFELASMLFSELNGFKREDALLILQKAAQACDQLVLEFQTLESMLDSDVPGRRWEVQQSGPFSPEPHLILTEHDFDETRQTITTVGSGWAREAANLCLLRRICHLEFYRPC